MGSYGFKGLKKKKGFYYVSTVSDLGEMGERKREEGRENREVLYYGYNGKKYVMNSKCYVVNNNFF